MAKSMRVSRQNKQKMYYSLYVGTDPVYETDDEGNIVYVSVDGEPVPVEIGTTEATYGTPVEFKAVISGHLNEMRMRAWGVDQSSIYSEVTCQKGYLPMQVGMLIWRTSEIQYDDEQHPLASSADYRVMGIMDEGLYEDKLLLQRITSDEQED